MGYGYLMIEGCKFENSSGCYPLLIGGGGVELRSDELRGSDVKREVVKGSDEKRGSDKKGNWKDGKKDRTSETGKGENKENGTGNKKNEIAGTSVMNGNKLIGSISSNSLSHLNSQFHSLYNSFMQSPSSHSNSLSHLNSLTHSPSPHHSHHKQLITNKSLEKTNNNLDQSISISKGYFEREHKRNFDLQCSLILNLFENILFVKEDFNKLTGGKIETNSFYLNLEAMVNLLKQIQEEFLILDEKRILLFYTRQILFQDYLQREREEILESFKEGEKEERECFEQKRVLCDRKNFVIRLYFSLIFGSLFGLGVFMVIF